MSVGSPPALGLGRARRLPVIPVMTRGQYKTLRAARRAHRYHCSSMDLIDGPSNDPSCVHLLPLPPTFGVPHAAAEQDHRFLRRLQRGAGFHGDPPRRRHSRRRGQPAARGDAPAGGQIRPRTAADLLEDAVLRARELLRQEPAGSEADAGGRAGFRPARRPGDPDRSLARARSQAGHGQGQRPAAQLLDRTRGRALEPAHQAAGDLPVRAAQSAAGPREGGVAPPGRDRDGGDQRHALHARPALGAARRRDLQGHAYPDPGEVRRSRHRHRDGQEEPHHGQAADARYARHPGRHQVQGSHRPHQQRIDDEHDLERGGRAPAR